MIPRGLKVDHILLFYGLWPNSENKRLYYLNWTLRLYFFLYNGFHLIDLGINKIKISFEAASFYLIGTFIVKAVFFNIYCLCKRKKLATLFEFVFGMEAKQVRSKSIIKITKQFFSAWILANLIASIWSVLIWYDVGTVQFLQLTYSLEISERTFLADVLSVIEVLSYTLFSIGWLLTTTLIYNYFAFVIKDITKQYFKVAEDVLTDTYIKTDKDFRQLRLQWDYIYHLKELFDDRFAFFPFLWFGSAFLEWCLIIVCIKFGFYSGTASFLTTSAEAANYILMNAFVFSTVYVAEKVNSSIQSNCSKLMSRLIEYEPCTEDERFQLLALMTEIKEKINFRLTGYAFFDLNASFILGFVGAVIPSCLFMLELIDTLSRELPANKLETTTVA